MKKNSYFIAGIIGLSMLMVMLLVSSKPGDIEGEGYATMIIYENFAVVNSKIIITYPDQETEIIDLGPFKYNETYLTENSKTITKALNNLRDKDFHVVSMTASGKINSNKSMRITTIILEKN